MALGKIEPHDFRQVVRANGVLDVPPDRRVTISSYFGGTVRDIPKLEGQYVRHGEVLLSLESPEFVQIQQDYLEAQGRLTYLKSDYERQKELVKDKVTSEKTYLKAESDYAVTRVQVASLAKKLSLMNIDPSGLSAEKLQSVIYMRAPISGYITRIDVNRGDFLNAAAAGIQMVNTEHLHLELNVFEKDLPKIQEGQAIQFSIQQDPGTTYRATVHLVNKAIDPKTRTIRVHGHLADAAAARFSPGMYVEAAISTVSTSRPALPADAVVALGSRKYVLMAAGQPDSTGTLLKRVEVETGLADEEAIEIKNANTLPAGAQYLVRGAFGLINE
jgi:cobalt-zinc-cadmium efflux system membrane fusion protein